MAAELSLSLEKLEYKMPLDDVIICLKNPRNREPSLCFKGNQCSKLRPNSWVDLVKLSLTEQLCGNNSEHSPCLSRLVCTARSDIAGTFGEAGQSLHSL
jgi:hypothetical protein